MDPQRAGGSDPLPILGASRLGTRGVLTPDMLAEMRDSIGTRRPLDGYVIVVEGATPIHDPGAAAAQSRRWADASVTWWIESDWEHGTVERVHEASRRAAARNDR